MEPVELLHVLANIHASWAMDFYSCIYTKGTHTRKKEEKTSMKTNYL